jgi:hypothetical protein
VVQLRAGTSDPGSLSQAAAMTGGDGLYLVPRIVEDIHREEDTNA